MRRVPVPTCGHRSYPALYEIRVEGRLDEGRAIWFEGMALSVQELEDGRTVTVLSGLVADRAALYSLLSRARDLGLHLLLVRRVESEA
jgi:hypothetical protein